MAENEILMERRGHTLVLTLNRPNHGNALTLDMANQLFAHLKNATTDRGTRAVLLRGNGDNFMVGHDMAMYAGEWDAAMEKSHQILLSYHSAIREIQNMEKPVIAAVRGNVGGPGFSFALAADFVIAAPDARFCCKCVENAMPPDGGLSYYLPRKIGLSRAVEMMMLNDEIDAAAALQLRLVNRVVEVADWLQDESFALADRLSEGPTKAFGFMKKLALMAFEQDIMKQLSLENTYLGHCSRSLDFRESVKASIAKRPPKFAGA